MWCQITNMHILYESMGDVIHIVTIKNNEKKGVCNIIASLQHADSISTYWLMLRARGI